MAEVDQLLPGHLLDLVRGVATLEGRAERPALDRLGQDDRRLILGLGGGVVGREQLAVVVPAPRQGLEVLVGQVLDQLAEAEVGAEEVVADVGAGLHAVALELAIDRRVHLCDEQPFTVPGDELVPAAAPHDLDDVPSAASEDRLELLDHLAVAADRTVESLQVAVDDPGQVVEPLPRRQGDRSQGLRFVDLAIAQEAPDTAARGVVDATVGQVLVEPGLVDRQDRSEPHGDRRVLPEIGHEAGVGVGRQAPSGRPRQVDLAAEPVQVGLGQATLEERPGVDAG